jgi:hypothetical protein
MLTRTATFQGMGHYGPPSFVASQQPGSPSLENITYQHIQDTASKRISTLDYLRKAYGPLMHALESRC